LSIALGYHGCNQEAAQALLSGLPFVASNQKYDWLGGGSYFWEDDIERAYAWALERRSNSPCVVGTVVELGNCLDLTKQSGIRAVQDAYNSYLKLQQRSGGEVARNEPGKAGMPGGLVLRYLDRAVIDHLHSLYLAASKATNGRTREFDTVRAMFPEGKELYPGAGFFEKTHVQIAVRNPQQILGVFRIPEHQLSRLGLSGMYSF
jgi:hypothetical protein